MKSRQKNTSSILDLKRRRLIAAAKLVPVDQIRVLPLALVAGVSKTTAAKWLKEAGFSLTTKPGRPPKGSYVTYDSITNLVSRAVVQGQENLDLAAKLEAESLETEETDVPE